MSTASSAPRDYELSTVKFSRLARRGVLLGLSAGQLLVVGIGAVVFVFALYSGGGAALTYSLPIMAVSAGLAWIGVGGRKLVEWFPIVARWLWRSSGGQLLFRRHVVKPRPAGTLALPGDAARLRNEGLQMIDLGADPAALGGCFFHPRSMGGILTEIIRDDSYPD